MATADDDKGGGNDEYASSSIAQKLRNALLTRGVVIERIEYCKDIKTVLVYLSTKYKAVIEIRPLEDAAKEVRTILEAVTDSKKDELCFFFIQFERIIE